jgi:ATP adenylyltransferase
MDERPLWAPWRIEYIQRPGKDECIFCSAAQGGEHSWAVIDRGKGCFTMLNAYPYASGHVMVAPYRHLGGLQELANEELLDLLHLARRAIAAQTEAMSPDGFNVGLNLGAVAGAGIADHLHLHVVPRWEGDTNFMPVIAGTRVLPQALEAARDALCAAIERVADA